MENSGDKVNFGLATPGEGSLTEHWTHPGLEYPSTPGLLVDPSKLHELCKFIELPQKRSASLDPSTGGIPEELLAVCEYELFKLQQPKGQKVPEEKHQLALSIAGKFHDRVKSNFLGFQANMANSYSHLSHYLDNHVNNIGDPFAVGSFLNQAKFMERAVLDYFAALWRAEWPHDVWTQLEPETRTKPPTPQNPSSYWGFVLSMGCTEGTLYGLWNGRDYLAGKIMLMDPTKPKPEPRYVIADTEIPDEPRQDSAGRPRPRRRSEASKTPICFFSSDSHYSLKKAMVILNIKTFHDVATELELKPPSEFGDQWPSEVPSNEDGSINVEKLAILVEVFAELGYPALICFNYGTTFKGAYDDVEQASDLLLPIFRKHNLLEREICYTEGGEQKSVKRNGFWFHVDGALGAAYMPFLRMAEKNKMFHPKTPILEFDFSLRGKNKEDYDYSKVEVVHSIGMSGHKWIGAPVPTGVYMTKSKYQLRPPGRPNYIGTPDTTFAGSRSGLASVFLWDYLARHSFNDLMVKAIYTEKIASRLAEKMQCLSEMVEKGEIHKQLTPPTLWVSHTPLSLGVIFRRPNKLIVQKYSLSEEEEVVNGEQRLLVHAYAMEHVTFDRIDRLMADLSEEGAFDIPESETASIQLHRFKIEW